MEAEDIIESIVADISESYDLAMRGEGLTADTRGNINQTVEDAVTNHFDQLLEYFKTEGA